MWCSLVMFCFSENVDKFSSKGRLYIYVISFGVSFFQTYMRIFSNVQTYIFQSTSCFGCASVILHDGFWSLIKSTFIESFVAPLVRFVFIT